MAKTIEEARNRNVYLFNDGEEEFVGMWDGKDYTIPPDDGIEISFGVAEHWIDTTKALKAHFELEGQPVPQLRIEEIPLEEIEKRKPANPLKSDTRGEAFQSLKRNKPGTKAKVEE